MSATATSSAVNSPRAARSASAEVKAVLAAVTDRLHNYARVHYALQMAEHSTYIDAAVYLRRLCHAISRSKLDREGIELELTDCPLWLESGRCWRLGMIVSEPNAARHAFLKRGDVIRVEPSLSHSFVECRVTDNGMAETSGRLVDLGRSSGNPRPLSA